MAAVKQLQLEWTEKYRPKSLSQLRGNDKAFATLRKWAIAWETGSPMKKGLILAGKPGTGKTSAAYALANDFNWGIIELNASDARNAENIKNIALVGSVNETFTATGEFVSVHSGGRKLIILDEADNLFERMTKKDAQDKDISDRGGKAAIIETLKKTQQPVILIVNDLYALIRDSGAPIKQLSEVIKLTRVRQPTVRMVLKQICEREEIEIMPDALDELSRRAGGDLRSGINDLQMLAVGTKKITYAQLNAVGYRNVKTTIFDAIREILKSTNLERARKAVWDLDESPEDIILWLDENLPLEYRRAPDLVKGYYMLSRADQFLGRVRRRQYYGLWSYAKDLMTSGVALAKQDSYHGWVKYQFPTWLLQMSRTKQIRQLQKGTAKKIGSHCHTSKKVAAQDILPYFRHIFKTEHSFAVEMCINLDFSNEEIGWLLEEKAGSNKVKYLLDEVKKTLECKGHRSATSQAVEIFPEVEKESNLGSSSSEKEKNLGEPIKEKVSGDEEHKAEDGKKKEKEKKVQKNLFDY